MVKGNSSRYVDCMDITRPTTAQPGTSIIATGPAAQTLTAGLGIRAHQTVSARVTGISVVSTAEKQAILASRNSAGSPPSPGSRALTEVVQSPDVRLIALTINGKVVHALSNLPLQLLQSVQVRLDAHGNLVLVPQNPPVPAGGPGAQNPAPHTSESPGSKSLLQMVLQSTSLRSQARSALAALNASGWTDEAIRAAALSVDFDLYRAVAVTYASAYGRYGVGAHPCGHTFAAQNPDFSPRAATAAERAAWWSDASGIPPGAGVGIIDPALAPPDLTGTGITCLRALWTGDGVDAQRVRTGVQQLASAPPRAGLPVVLVHGRDDGLIPIAFTSAPYAAAARAAGRDVRLWEVRNAQHFDGFLALPDYAARYVPLLPYVYAALDRVQAHLDGQAGLPADAVIETRPGGTLDAAALAIPGR